MSYLAPLEGVAAIASKEERGKRSSKAHIYIYIYIKNKIKSPQKTTKLPKKEPTWSVNRIGL
jgi:hypothetical protein